MKNLFAVVKKSWVYLHFSKDDRATTVFPAGEVSYEPISQVFKLPSFHYLLLNSNREGKFLFSIQNPSCRVQSTLNALLDMNFGARHELWR